MRFCLLFLLLIASAASAQTIYTETLFAAGINDSFVIRIRKPAGFSEKQSYHHIYVADGSLKLGNYVMGKDSSWRANVPENCIVISIGHTGDWHIKRQRDFLPSDAGGYKDKNWGQAHAFYLFLKNTLIPRINTKYQHKLSSAFIGHSFSGLFCLYTLFQDDKLFDKHFAISPSVWANHGELMKIEQRFYQQKKQLTGTVSLQAGGLEVLNKVLSSTREFYNTTLSRKYKNYTVGFSTVRNANHYSIIKPGVDKALQTFRN